VLRFANKPDDIFVLLINEAIEDMISYLEMDEDVDERQDALRASMPRSSALFDAADVMAQLGTLREFLNADKLYKPSDYHWLLLYECLRSYCDYFNDEHPGDVYKVHHIESIDFAWLIDYYFWDTDFLSDDIPNLTVEQRRGLGVSSETFGLTAGLKPDSEELKLTACDAELLQEFQGPPISLFTPGSKEYPSTADPQDN
jgi:hypothetical protein